MKKKLVSIVTVIIGAAAAGFLKHWLGKEEEAAEEVESA